MNVKWLHISDIHFNINNYSCNDLRKELLNYLKGMKINCDFIAITGDISYQYNYNNEYTDEMVDFITQLRKTVKVAENDLFIVPGNHDLKRDSHDRLTYIRGIVATKDKFEEMNSASNKSIEALLNDHKYYYDFLKKINNDGYSNFNKVHCAYEKEKFNILSLNTCLSYTKENTDKLLICQSKLPKEIDNWKNGEKINIAIGHHNFDFMESTQKKKLIHKFSNSGIDLYLCGHIHEPDFEKIYDLNDITVFVSGSNYVDDHSISSFTIGEIDLQTGQGHALLHIWDKEDDRWKKADTRKYKNGKRIFTINRLKKNDVLITRSETAVTLENKEIDTYNFPNLSSDIKSIHIHIDDHMREVQNNRINFERNTITKNSKKLYNINVDNVGVDTHYSNLNLDSNNGILLKYIDLFKKNTINIIKTSVNGNDIELNYKQLMLLGSRIAIIFEDHLNYDIDFNILNKLDNLKQNCLETSSRNNILSEFIIFISMWIKYLYRLLNGSTGKETLNEIALKLYLIQSFNETNTSSKYSELEKACFITISNINQYEGNNSINTVSYNNIVKYGLLTLLYSIYQNKDKIIKKTQCFILNNIEDPEIETLLKVTLNEQKKHLKQFMGRDLYINKILEFIKNDDYNNLILLYGRGQVGKSSLLSKTVEKLCYENKVLGKYAGELNDCAPWITSTIYHSGRQSNNIFEMMKSIIFQANARLIDKISIDRINAINSTLCKRLIQDTLNRMICECGKALLIIDGINNIVKEVNELDFLPEDIPQGAHIVISMEQDSQMIKWLKSNRCTKLLELGEISRGEIPLFTKVKDKEKNCNSNKFNDAVYKKLSYMPGKIIEISKGIDIEDNNYSNINLDIDKDELFLEACENWSGEDYEDNNNLQEMLLLLSLFEPVCSLDIELIQLYFKSRNIIHKLPYYRKLLIKVKNQVEGVDSTRVKLSNKNFSEYVVNTYFSRLDIEEIIDTIFKWFLNYSNISKKLICEFIKYWKKSKRIDEEFFKNKIDYFLNQLKNNKQSKILFSIANVIYNDDLKLDDIAVKCLELCLSLDDSSIKVTYAIRLIKGNKVNKDLKKGKKILKDLADSGNEKAQFILGRMLILGIDLKKDIVEGEKYLRTSADFGFIDAKVFLAAILLDGNIIEADYKKAFDYLDSSVKEGDVWAKAILGDALINGLKLTENKQLGEKLLRESANSGNERAKELLANRLIDGYGLEKNPQEGEELLKELIEKGSDEAKINMSNRLLDGDGINKNVEEGKRLLLELYNSGNIHAKRILADRLLDGIGIEIDKTKGENILKELTENGDKESKFNLANRLIDGISLNKSISEGEALLKELINEDYSEAKINYANRLIDNDRLEKNILKGKQLLEELVLDGNKEATIILAKKLIYGYGLNLDVNRGIELLKKCSHSSLKAQMELGVALINAKHKESFKGEGEKILRKIALSGHKESKFKLGVMLLEGDGIEKNLVEGEKLLNELIEVGYRKAQIILGNLILDGHTIDRNKKRGELLLKDAANSGSEYANYFLGLRLINGDGIKRNIEEGKILLKRAINLGCRDGKYSLAIMLLDGNGVNKNAQKGEKLLYEAVKEGDENAKLELSVRLLDGRGIKKDKIKGEALLREVAESGEYNANIILGNRLIDAIGIDRNIDEGVSILKKLVNNGNAKAKHSLAIRLLNGNNIPKDSVKGEKLLREAAESYSKSKIRLANILVDGIGIEKNLDEGIKIFEELLKDGSNEGKYIYAERLIDGDGVTKDSERGFTMLNELISNDYLKAKYSLACRLLDGENIPSNEVEGEKLLKEAADYNYIPARLELGERIIKGNRICYDIKLGEKMLRELINEGNIQAAIKLGKFFIENSYLYGNIDKGITILNEILSEQDIKIKHKLEYTTVCKILSSHYFNLGDIQGKIMGLKYLKNAVQFQDLEAICELGLRYIDGNGVNKSVSKGRKNLDKAYKLGNLYAKYEIGRRMKDGIKYSKDEKEGDKYINEVIEKGDSEDLRDMGLSYYLRSNFEDATILFNKAFEKGSRTAGNNLVYMLRRNEVKTSIKIINDIEILLKESLDNNEIFSIINYALCYASGFQKETDWKQADQLFSKLNNVMPAVAWWYDILIKKDTEGDLVIGWLVRHNFIEDPNGLTVKSRMDKVRSSGWTIPTWMDIKL